MDEKEKNTDDLELDSNGETLPGEETGSDEETLPEDLDNETDEVDEEEEEEVE